MAGRRHGAPFAVQTRNDGKREFYEHDDRGDGSNRRSNNSGRGGRWQYQNNYRGRGSYRGGNTKGGRGGYRDWNDDAPMGDEKTRYQRMYERGRGGHRGNKVYKPVKKTITSTKSGWHKIFIKNFNDADENEVIATLRRYIDEDFTPIMPVYHPLRFTFFLEDNPSTVGAMVTLSNRVAVNGGIKMFISYVDATPPYIKLNDQQVEIVQKVMSDRYSIEMNRIDLKNFHNDPKLIQAGIFCPLSNVSALNLVLDIITKNIPAISEIDLSCNKMYSTKSLDHLADCENLRTLNIERNKIASVANLVKIKGLNLLGIHLDGNPLRETFRTKEEYISAVRKIIPKITRLDGLELPKAIGFEVDENSKLPPSKSSFFCSEEVKGLILKFIEQYYQVFESKNRRALEAAYTDKARFSIIAFIPDASSNTRGTKSYFVHSRNLLKVLNAERRQKTLIYGRKNIVDVLSTFPACTHDPASFVVDVPVAQPQLLHVSLRGLFRQITEDSEANPIRHFMRSMIIVPVGSGFCIANEELFVTGATQVQIKKAFKNRISETVNRAPLPESAKAELVQQFSAQSKMLPEFCHQCLENNGWNFNKAAEMFLSLKESNQVPQHYYLNAV